VQDAYTLVFGGLLLLGARAGDCWGRDTGAMIVVRPDQYVAHVLPSPSTTPWPSSSPGHHAARVTSSS